MGSGWGESERPPVYLLRILGEEESVVDPLVVEKKERLPREGSLMGCELGFWASPRVVAYIRMIILIMLKAKASTPTKKRPNSNSA
jgi:hypothetical protein